MALPGLSGLYGPPQDQQQYMDAGVLEARAAPGTATSHGAYGSQSAGYGGPDPSVSAEPQQQVYDAGTDQDQYWASDFSEGGTGLDLTPTTHRAKWPEGIPQTDGGSLSTPGGLEIAAEQMRILHGTDRGGVRHMVLKDPAGHETPSDYTTDNYSAPNQSLLAGVPGQLKGANGSSSGLLGGGGSGHGNAGGSAADVDQGYGVNNTLPEFNAGHSIRRIQHDRMPWDFTATHGEQDVPFLGRHALVGQMSFDGPDSPYYAAGSIQGNQVPWEGRIGDPTEYIQPPEPAVAPATTGSQEDIYAWG